jgi:transcription elongation GreA/GreB family factor
MLKPSDKQTIKAAAMQWVQNNIHQAEAGLAQLREAIAAETKSSAGDKYETSRSMMQIETGKLTGQLQLQKQFLATLQNQPDTRLHQVVEAGAVVQLANMNLFVSVPIGAIQVKGNAVHCISPMSPLAQALMGKKVGDTVSINGNIQTIISIC